MAEVNTVEKRSKKKKSDKASSKSSQSIIFIPAIGTLGDVLPFLSVAERLVKQGHIVRFAMHARHKHILKSLPGLEWVEIKADLEGLMASDPEIRAAIANPSPFGGSKIQDAFFPLQQEWFQVINNGTKDANLLVITGTTLPFAFSALELNPNLHAVCLFLGPQTPSAEYAPIIGSGSTSWFNWVNKLKWSVFDKMYWKMFAATVNKLRRDIKLPEVKKSMVDHLATIRPNPILTLTAYSNELLPRPSDWPSHIDMIPPLFPEPEHREYDPPKELTSFLDAEEQKPIYIGIGSMMFTMLAESEQEQTIKTWIAGVKAAGVRAIINLSGIGKSIAKFQSDKDVFIITSFLPHHWLFPKLAGVVHHGGAGTLHAGLAYGLPTLILPFGADQPFNGDRVKIQKLGPAPIPIRSVTVSNFASAVRALVHEKAFAQNAARVSQKLLQEDGVGTAVHAIEETLNGNVIRAPFPVKLLQT